MRFRMRALAVLAAFVLSWSPPAAAQEQSGAIQGTIKDASGAVLPGVAVEARALTGGVSLAVTDEQGIYRFPALPPGTYEITAKLDGFVPATSQNAVLVLGKMLTIDLALQPKGITETVEVRAESPLIDVKQNAAYATIQGDTINRIPKGRDFTSILRQAPGAQDESKSGGTQIDGASGSENRFIIDGMDTTALVDGTSGKTMLLDFVAEVQVKSSGYNAEFGGATGGVISVLTKSGTNAFHGQAGTYYTGDQFYGERRPFSRFNPENTSITESGLVTPDDKWTYWSPLADVGGPIIRDRLWFYGGTAYTKNTYDRDAIFKTDASKTNRHFDWWDDAKYYNYNVTTQLSNNMRVKFSGSNQRNTSRGTAPGLQPDNARDLLPSAIYPNGVPSRGMTLGTFDRNPDGSINQEAYNNRWVNQGDDRTNDTYSGNFDWVIKPTFFVNVSGGSYRTNRTTPEEFRGNEVRHIFSGTNDDATMARLGYPSVPGQFQQPSGYSDVRSSNGTARDIFTRRFLNANATFFQHFAGQHTIKTGMRFERFGNDVLSGRVKPEVTLFWGQGYTNDAGQTLSGRYGYYIVEQFGTIGKVYSNNYSFWVQDSWDVNPRLTINAGVRAENEHIPSFKDQALYPDALDIKFGFADKIAPRLGFAYDIKGDGKWIAKGDYGWFYDITKLDLPRGSFGGDHWVQYFWTLDDPDFSKIQCGEGTTGCPGTYIGPPNGSDLRHSSNQTDPFFEEYFNRPGMTGIDPDMKPVRTGAFGAELDHELSPNMSLKVRYAHKWMFRTIEDVGILFKGVEDYLISNPGEGLAEHMEPLFPDKPVVKPKRKYDGVEVTFNRRLSNNWTGQVSYLWSRLYGNYSGLASADENGRVDPNVNRYFDHTIMNYGSDGKPVYGRLPTDRPHMVKAYGAYDFKWGTTLGANWFIQSGAPQTTVFLFNGGGAGYPVFAYGRGDLGRSPVLSQLDLNVSHDVKLMGNTRANVSVNIDNVFDQDTWINLYAPRGYGPQKYVSKAGAAGSGVGLAAPFPELLSGPYDPDALVQNAINSGANLTLNPFYTTPNTFQSRRSMRFQVRLTF